MIRSVHSSKHRLVGLLRQLIIRSPYVQCQQNNSPPIEIPFSLKSNAIIINFHFNFSANNITIFAENIRLSKSCFQLLFNSSFKTRDEKIIYNSRCNSESNSPENSQLFQFLAVYFVLRSEVRFKDLLNASFYIWEWQSSKTKKKHRTCIWNASIKKTCRNNFS